jgi:putative peptidoglycan lipid II flippase
LADPEGPALLWYAIRIQQLPLALFGIAIAGAVLPPLSRALKAQRIDDYHHFLQYALYRTWTFMLPLTALLFVMGDSSVALLFGRGDFGPNSVIGTTYCLWAYGVGLVPSALVLILAPGCYAQNNYHLPAIASLGSMGLNILLNALFILSFGWGAVSVALATSLSAWINFFFLSGVLSRSGTKLFSQPFLMQGFKIILATGVALAATYWMRLSILQLPFFSNVLLSSSLVDQAWFLSCQILFFGSVFFLGINWSFVVKRVFVQSTPQ